MQTAASSCALTGKVPARKKLISHNDKDGFGRERSRKTQAFVAVRSQVNNTHTEEVGRDRTNIPTELPQSDSFQGQQKT